jgi:hypothetical protein
LYLNKNKNIKYDFIFLKIILKKMAFLSSKIAEELKNRFVMNDNSFKKEYSFDGENDTIDYSYWKNGTKYSMSIEGIDENTAKLHCLILNGSLFTTIVKSLEEFKETLQIQGF